MQKDEINNLLKRYNAGVCTDQEKDLVETWYLQYEPFSTNDLTAHERIADLEKIWRSLPVNQPVVKRMGVTYRIAAAASILVFLLLGIYYIGFKNDEQAQVIQTLAKQLKPGGNKAILTLSNGNQIVLTDAKNGQLTDQDDVTVLKTADGELVYTGSANKANAPLYNTMATPSGGTYTLTLADGTRVMLDAASSIRYPVSFSGKTRTVEITGQAYFEVAHNAAKPFMVTSKGQTVMVLGTHFNVNAYEEENAVTTTLLQGSVKVFNATQNAILTPGQQSVIAKNNMAIKVKAADAETAVAWKNGSFRFKRADLPTVMRQFSRWYNVEVVYSGAVPNVAITGKVLRTANASQVLEIINKLGIKFRAEGNKITILEK